VRLPLDARFVAEAQRYDFRFTCEDCLRFVKDDGTCAHEWPNQDHREFSFEAPPPEIVFCKEFEAQ
jgi:hypothetical protein